MLTPEQTRLRIRDNEMRELRAENMRLTNKVAELRNAMKQVVLGVSDLSGLPYYSRVKLRELANSIEI